jgi:hypothetical protein
MLNRGDRREPIYRDQQDRSGCGWGGRIGGQWRARPEKQMKINNMWLCGLDPFTENMGPADNYLP